MKGMNFFILASGCILAAALASCTSIDEPVPEPSSSPIGFSPAVNDANTRYASDDLPATMGVFAYLTEGSGFNASTSTPNFMYNQLVTRNGTTWSYTPVKYWPTNANDKVSFFAYAPHNASGLTPCANTQKGYPLFTYTVPELEINQVDLLVSNSLLNCVQTSGSLNFIMKHALTKVTVYAKSDDLAAGKVVNNLSIAAPQSGTITFQPDNFIWTISAEKTEYIASQKNVTISDVASERVLLGTFYLLPDKAKSLLNITYTVIGTITDNVNPPIDTSVITGQAFPDTYNWLPGASIVYTVNIARKSLEVVAESSSMEWTGGATDEVELYAPAQLKLGDYYYNDGSWSDGGLRGMNKTTKTRIWHSSLPGPNLTNPETNSTRKCIGVIFAVEGDDVITDPTTVKAMVVAPKDEKTNQQCYPSTETTTADFPPPGNVLSSEWYHTDEKILRWLAKGDGSTATYLREILDEHLIKIENGTKLEGQYWVYPYSMHGAARYAMNLTSGSYYDINYLHTASFRLVLNVLK